MKPVLVSTWNHGMGANRAGWPYLERGSALDAVEHAVRCAEADPAVRSVGRGGYPDGLGRITLDAVIMDHAFRAGAVAAIEGFVHAVSVARAVMERTTHVLLAGQGACEFALSLGMQRENLVVAETMRLFEERLAEAAHDRPNFENHDTIVTLGLDASGRLAGACSTSGLMNRLHGRVGDSPVVGAGLYVDGEVGAAGATGVGELALRVSASALVVERMRTGRSVQEACESVIRLIRDRLHPGPRQQLAIIALDANGESGSSALLPGFTYARSVDGIHEEVDSAAIG
jgi:N4-(beta-N-acetylglucosaminyl)-L-asparaginase